MAVSVIPNPNLILTDKCSATRTFTNANEYIQATIPSHAGYTPIGILAWNCSSGGSSQNYAYPWSLAFGDNKALLAVKNVSNFTGAITVTCEFTILYVKNSL